jgi:hypothetical protein
MSYTYQSAAVFDFEVRIYVSETDTQNLSSIEVDMGDNTPVQQVPISSTESLCNGIKCNHYQFAYDYGSLTYGVFQVSWVDTLRVEDRLNFPTATNAAVALVCWLERSHFPMYDNSGVKFSSHPTFVSQVDQELRYTLVTSDAEADSLLFQLVDLDYSGTAYSDPPGLTLNSNTGEIIWNSPPQTGLYEIAVKVSEYRDGFFVGSAMQSITIKVVPQISAAFFQGQDLWPTQSGNIWVTPDDLCNLTFSYSDPMADSVALQSFGEPFALIGNPATTVENVTTNQIDCTFDWIPEQSEERTTPYVVTFRGTSFVDTSCFYHDLSAVIFVGEPVGIVPTSYNTFEVDVFPNPSSGLFSIRRERVLNSSLTVSVYDPIGQLIKVESSSLNSLEIDLSGFSNGIYLLRIDEGTSVVMRKVILN